MRKLTFMELALVAMIRQAPRSGYDARKEFLSTPVGRCSGSPGAVYPALKRLEAFGLIAGRVRNRDSLRPKTTYRITRRGEEALRAHLTRPITRNDVVWHMDDLMLRFVHAEEILGLAGSLEMAEELRREIRGFSAEMTEFTGQVATRVSLTAELALQHALDTFQVHEKWVSNAVRRLRAKLKGS